jgi:hypothetical protein
MTRFKAGLLADNYQSIIGSGHVYTDANFGGVSSITWTDYPNTQISFKSFADPSRFARLTTKYTSPVLFGSSIGPGDIDQGVDSDCYVLASAAAVA